MGQGPIPRLSRDNLGPLYYITINAIYCNIFSAFLPSALTLVDDWLIDLQHKYQHDEHVFCLVPLRARLKAFHVPISAKP